MKPVSSTPAEQPATLTRALSHPDLTREEEAALAARVAAGDQSAVDELTLKNARLAYSFAVSYSRKFSLGGGAVSVEDLFQEAWLGVRVAAARFKEAKASFATFAKYRIREKILLHVYAFAFGPSEVPHKMMRIHRAVWRARGELLSEIGREPTKEEVAERADVSVKHAAQFLLLGMETLSLNEPVRAEQADGATLLDTLADEACDLGGGALASADAGEFLSVLSDRQAAVIKLRFGIGTGEPLENVRIAERLKMSREGVRIVADKAMLLLNQRKDWLRAQQDKLRSA